MSMTISHESDSQDLSAFFALQEQLDRVATQLLIEPISKFFEDLRALVPGPEAAASAQKQVHLLVVM